MRKYKTTARKTDLAAAIADGYEALSSLRDEIQEIVDNAPDNFRSTERIETFENNLSLLDSCDNPPEIPESISERTVEYSESYKRGHASRAVRCSNACNMLRAACDVLEAAEDEFPDDGLDDIRGEIEQVIDSGESCEWPGMFG